MRENKNLNRVKEFQLTGGHNVLPIHKEPSIEDRELRLKLIFEELTELAGAYGMDKVFTDMCEEHLHLTAEIENTFEFNQVEALDALCDLEVVVLGGYCISGFNEIAQEAFDETMDSNMSKFCNNLEDALLSIAFKDDLSFKEIEGKYVIYSEETGKILKGVNFKKPNYTNLLNGSTKI